MQDQWQYLRRGHSLLEKDKPLLPVSVPPSAPKDRGSSHRVVDVPSFTSPHSRGSCAPAAWLTTASSRQTPPCWGRSRCGCPALPALLLPQNRHRIQLLNGAGVLRLQVRGAFVWYVITFQIKIKAKPRQAGRVLSSHPHPRWLEVSNLRTMRPLSSEPKGTLSTSLASAQACSQNTQWGRMPGLTQECSLESGRRLPAERAGLLRPTALDVSLFLMFTAESLTTNKIISA